jgi:hypothetical protein
MITKAVAAIREIDLQLLVDNSVLERKTLEYARSLPSSDSEKIEFLAEVSSLANTLGGELVYGIAQDNKTGFPSKLEGLNLRNVEQEIMRLENCIKDGIEPRIPSVTFTPVVLSNSRIALVVKVQKSWNLPHRVKFQGYNRFFSRNTNGIYEMDLEELRVAFGFSDTIAEKITKFREQRISKLYSNEVPVPFSRHAKIMLHLMPLVSFTPGKRYDINKMANEHANLMAPIYCGSYSHRYNLDGFLTYASGEVSDSYVQLFRNGVIEVVEGFLLKPEGEELLIPSVSYEEELIESLPRYLAVLKTLNIELPFLVFMTLIGVKGYSMSTAGVLYRGRTPIERDVLPLPEILIDSYDVAADKILKPFFDCVWNACGFERSLNYDGSGNWRPKR